MEVEEIVEPLKKIKTEKDVQEIHTRWDRWRQKWLDTKNPGNDPCFRIWIIVFLLFNYYLVAYIYPSNDAKDGIDCEPLPTEGREIRKIKDIMRSTRGPYSSFKCYYALEEVIDIYMEIWFEESSD